MNHVARAEIGLTEAEKATAERMADAFADAFARLVPEARIVGRRWESWPEDAVFLVVDVTVPRPLLDDTQGLIERERRAKAMLRADGVPWSGRMVAEYTQRIDAA